MIQIKRNTLWHWLYRFNARWSITDPPKHSTDLCQFMRCVLLWLPLKLITPALLLAAGVAWWEAALKGIMMLLSITAVVAVMAVAAVYSTDHPLSRSLIWQYLKAKKQKICPIVYVE